MADRLPVDADLLTNPLRRAILTFIRENPGASRRELMEAIVRSPSTVDWHLRKLARAGYIEATSTDIRPGYRVLDPPSPPIRQQHRQRLVAFA